MWHHRKLYMWRLSSRKAWESEEDVLSLPLELECVWAPLREKQQSSVSTCFSLLAALQRSWGGSWSNDPPVRINQKVATSLLCEEDIKKAQPSLWLCQTTGADKDNLPVISEIKVKTSKLLLPPSLLLRVGEESPLDVDDRIYNKMSS